MTTENSLQHQWQEAFSRMPLIAILRGVTPAECIDVAETIFEAGFRILEIPLNSPDPFDSIERLTSTFPDQFNGAGTVTSVANLERCLAVGCKLIVTPTLQGPNVSAKENRHRAPVSLPPMLDGEAPHQHGTRPGAEV